MHKINIDAVAGTLNLNDIVIAPVSLAVFRERLAAACRHEQGSAWNKPTDFASPEFRISSARSGVSSKKGHVCCYKHCKRARSDEVRPRRRNTILSFRL